MKLVKTGIVGLLALGVVAYTSGTIVSATSVAQDPAHASKTPLEISPLCHTDLLAYWNVNNKDSNDVIITYKVNGQTGTYDAPAGNTKFSAPYKQNDNNTTEFIYTAEDKSTSTGYQIDSVSRNASSEKCAETPSTTQPVTTEPVTTTPITNEPTAAAPSTSTTTPTDTTVEEVAQPSGFVGK